MNMDMLNWNKDSEHDDVHVPTIIMHGGHHWDEVFNQNIQINHALEDLPRTVLR